MIVNALFLQKNGDVMSKEDLQELMGGQNGVDGGPLVTQSLNESVLLGLSSSV